MDINEARNDWVWNGSGIGWTTCKQSAPRSRQKTTPTSHHSIFTVQMLFLVSIQQCQSTERNSTEDDNLHELRMRLGTSSGISSTVTVAFVLLPLLEDQDSRHITKKQSSVSIPTGTKMFSAGDEKSWSTAAASVPLAICSMLAVQ